jgi:hypothetical protein
LDGPSPVVGAVLVHMTNTKTSALVVPASVGSSSGVGGIIKHTVGL